jgi:hypothetical protein
VTIVRRSGKKTSSTVQSKLPARSPDVPAPRTICASERWKTPASGRRRRPAAARLVAVENLEAAQHPFSRAGPRASDRHPVATIDRHGPPAPHHGGAGDDGVGPVLDLDALVRQTERDELAMLLVARFQPTDPATSANSSTTRT